MKQIDLLYQELKNEVLKDIDIMIIRAGGNYTDAAIKTKTNLKVFYRYMTGDCSFATAMVLHKKICELIAKGEKFKRKRMTRTFPHHDSPKGRKKQEDSNE